MYVERSSTAIRPTDFPHASTAIRAWSARSEEPSTREGSGWGFRAATASRWSGAEPVRLYFAHARSTWRSTRLSTRPSEWIAWSGAPPYGQRPRTRWHLPLATRITYLQD